MYLNCGDGELSLLELSAVDNYCISPAIKFALKNSYGSILQSEYSLVLVRLLRTVFRYLSLLPIPLTITISA